MPTGGDPAALDRHDPRAVDGRGAEGQLRAPRHGDGARAAGLHALQALPAAPTRRAPTGPTATASSSAPGHACVLQYSLLHLDRLRARRSRTSKQFRQWGSLTPGHPERGHTPGIEVTTGPARAGRRQRRRHGDGRALPRRPLQPPRPRDRRPPRVRDLLRRRPDGGDQPGSRLDRRPLRPRQADRLLRRQPHHDRRHARRSPSTARTTPTRLAADGWHVQRVDGLRGRGGARRGDRRRARKRERPSFIAIRSHIAYPAPNAIDTAKSHGAPLGEDEVRATKEVMGFDPDRELLGRRARLRAHVAARSAAPPPQREWQRALRSLARGLPGDGRGLGPRLGGASCARAGARRCRRSTPARRSPRARRAEGDGVVRRVRARR